MSESSQPSASLTFPNIAKEITRFLWQEINFLPDCLQRHWVVVSTFTSGVVLASTVNKLFRRYKQDREKTELVVFHIVRQFEACPGRKELIAEPPELITEMDREVAFLIDLDLSKPGASEYLATIFARNLKAAYSKKNVDQEDQRPLHANADEGVVDKTNTQPAGSSVQANVDISDSTPASTSTSTPRGGYGLDYDDPVLYPTPLSSPSSSPPSSPPSTPPHLPPHPRTQPKSWAASQDEMAAHVAIRTAALRERWARIKVRQALEQLNRPKNARRRNAPRDRAVLWTRKSTAHEPPHGGRNQTPNLRRSSRKTRYIGKYTR